MPGAPSSVLYLEESNVCDILGMLQGANRRQLSTLPLTL